MFALFNRNFINLKLIKVCRNFSKNNHFIVSEEVKSALRDNQPVVALESTIITHGMPYPHNVKCALDVETVVRNQGAIPATVAILEGQIKVGLNESELSQLGDVMKSRPIKTSRRDLPFVISKKLNGGTTVSGTLIVAKEIGIPIFATGGIGGVHREGETTFDISADLIELGKSNVAVISSGVKSILDIPKTLEYLETQGVFVATFGAGSTDFPAFYSRKSGFHVPYSVETAEDAAEIIHCNHNLNMNSGMLFAVPVPEKFSFDEKIINDVIEKALKDAKEGGIKGKEITPFLLGKIAEITTGKSLETNIELIKNNAETAAAIAVKLANLRRKVSRTCNEIKDKARPMVIGGSNLDCSIKLQDDNIKLDGRIHYGKSMVTGGGVGRNICEALSKLGCPHIFISVIGNDAQGIILKDFIPKEQMKYVQILDGRRSGQCTVIFDSKGECKFLTGDMDIHQQITPQMILENEELIKNAPLIVFDGNLTLDTTEAILEIAEKYNIPVFFEPTDVVVSDKPFASKYRQAINFITPNLNELRHISSFLQIPSQEKYNDKLNEVADIAGKLTNYVDNVIVTLGPDGVIIARRGEASDHFFQKSSKLKVRHYPGTKIKGVVNVSGAGDSLASGIIAAIVNGLTEEECIAVGFAAAETALFSSSPIAGVLFGKSHKAWRTKAFYKTLI